MVGLPVRDVLDFFRGVSFYVVVLIKKIINIMLIRIILITNTNDIVQQFDT